MQIIDDAKDWLGLIMVMIFAFLAGVVSLMFLLLWSPFLIAAMALDYYEERKRIR